MKKTILFLVILFFLCSLTGFAVPCKSAFASSNNQLVFVAGEKTFRFDFQNELTSSKIELLNKIQNFGLTTKEQVDYVFPEFKNLLKKVSSATNIPETPSDVQVVLNKCQIRFKDGADGVYIDTFLAYENFFNQVKNNQKSIKIKFLPSSGGSAGPWYSHSGYRSTGSCFCSSW